MATMTNNNLQITKKKKKKKKKQHNKKQKNKQTIALKKNDSNNIQNENIIHINNNEAKYKQNEKHQLITPSTSSSSYSTVLTNDDHKHNTNSSKIIIHKKNVSIKSYRSQATNDTIVEHIMESSLSNNNNTDDNKNKQNSGKNIVSPVISLEMSVTDSTALENVVLSDDSTTQTPRNIGDYSPNNKANIHRNNEENSHTNDHNDNNNDINTNIMHKHKKKQSDFISGPNNDGLHIINDYDEDEIDNDLVTNRYGNNDGNDDENHHGNRNKQSHNETLQVIIPLTQTASLRFVSQQPKPKQKQHVARSKSYGNVLLAGDMKLDEIEDDNDNDNNIENNTTLNIDIDLNNVRRNSSLKIRRNSDTNIMIPVTPAANEILLTDYSEMNHISANNVAENNSNDIANNNAKLKSRPWYKKIFQSKKKRYFYFFQ